MSTLKRYRVWVDGARFEFGPDEEDLVMAFVGTAITKRCDSGTKQIPRLSVEKEFWDDETARLTDCSVKRAECSKDKGSSEF